MGWRFKGSGEEDATIADMSDAGILRDLNNILRLSVKKRDGIWGWSSVVMSITIIVRWNLWLSYLECRKEDTIKRKDTTWYRQSSLVWRRNGCGFGCATSQASHPSPSLPPSLTICRILRFLFTGLRVLRHRLYCSPSSLFLFPSSSIGSFALGCSSIFSKIMQFSSKEFYPWYFSTPLSPRTQYHSLYVNPSSEPT